jgi:head-tail adaptor
MITNEICYLGALKKTVNTYGDAVSSVVYGSKVYCSMRSMKYSEFYQAAAVGMKPELALSLRREDYANQTYVKYNDIEYRVQRTYITDKSRIELTLYRDNRTVS